MITPQIVMESFRTVRKNTIEVARDIPADQYSYRATPDTRTVLEYFRDILRVTEFIAGVALHPSEVSYEVRSREQWALDFLRTNGGRLQGRDDVVEALQRSMDDIYSRTITADPDFLNQEVRFPDGIVKVRLWAINTAKEQEMVMRGQLMLIERMLGIVPHTTRLRQAKGKEPG